MLMNRKRGSLTIEASIVLPLLIVAIAAIIYMMKVYYIQDEVQSAMTKVAHEMSVHAYAVDKVGIVDLQQDVFSDAASDLSNLESATRSVMSQGEVVISNIGGMTDFASNTFTTMQTIPEIKDIGNIIELVAVVQEVVEVAPVMVDGIKENMISFIDGIKGLMEEAGAGIGGVVKYEILDFSNGVIAKSIARSMMKNYISDEQFEAWGVFSGANYIDLDDSNMMLIDDTIEIVARYKIKLPFLSSMTEGFPIYQTVKVRAWTGSYDYNEKKVRAKVDVEEDEEDVDKDEDEENTRYYISTDSKAGSYHILSCLRKELNTGTYKDTESRDTCKYCQDHFNVTGDDMSVYYTSATSKIHYSPHCPKVYSASIKAVTKEWAEANGYTPCGKHGCVKTLEGGDK